MFRALGGERDARIVNGLRRYWWLIVVVALISGVGAYEFANRKPKMYAATSALLFQNSQLEQTLLGSSVFSGSNDPSRQAATNQSLVRLPTVASRVAVQLNIPTSRLSSEITIGADVQSDVLTVTATDRGPDTAAKIANAYVAQFIAFRQESDRAQLAQAQHVIASQLAAIPATQRLGAAAQALTARSLELQALGGLKTDTAEVVETATPPKSPSSPNPTKSAVLGVILGLLAGGVLALLLERRDRRIRSVADVEELYGLPVLGTIPESAALRGPGAAGTNREQDAFRMIRARLRYFDRERPIKLVMVTSPAGGEGKSMVALNLARAAGRTVDTRVLLIDTDMRRPSLAKLVGREGAVGLSELLGRQQVLNLNFSLREAVVTPVHAGGDGPTGQFDVLVAGAPPRNPVELLESKRMAELLEQAGSLYDVVIIDTPPIGPVSDPISLVHQVDGVLVVCRLGHSRRDHPAPLMKQLRALNAHILGVVVNGFEAGRGSYGQYGYDSVARGQAPPRGRRGDRRRSPSSAE